MKTLLCERLGIDLPIDPGSDGWSVGPALAAAVSNVPFAVGLYITAAYWFTASTSFANPAVTSQSGRSNMPCAARVERQPPTICAAT